VCYFTEIIQISHMVKMAFLQQSFTIGGCSSQPFQSVRCSRGEFLPSNSMCKAYSQKVEKLLKFESSVSSILSMLKASIQALALNAMTQAPSAQRVKRASISPHSHPPSKRPALEDSRLMPSTVSAKTTSNNEILIE